MAIVFFEDYPFKCMKQKFPKSFKLVIHNMIGKTDALWDKK